MKLIHPNLILGLFVFVIVTSCKKEGTKPNQPPIADAGTSQSITLPTDKVTLHGNGTDADGKVVTYLWSQVSGPAAATIVNPGATSTDVTGLVKGSYIFQLMVTDDKGATGADTTSVIVNPSPIDTLTLSPFNNPWEYEFAINNGQDQSGPNGPEYPLAAWTDNGGPFITRQSVKFDLSSIPSNATITNATLSLFSDLTPQSGNFTNANYGTDNSFLIQQITSPWSTSTVNWNNIPSVTSDNQVVVPTTSNSFLDLNLDVTNMVASMVNNNTNYGFYLRLQSETAYTSRIFCSSNYPDTTRRPKLVVVYKTN
jgi:hypothetical protein